MQKITFANLIEHDTVTFNTASTQKKIYKKKIKLVFTKFSRQYFTLSFNIKIKNIYKNIDIY